MWWSDGNPGFGLRRYPEDEEDLAWEEDLDDGEDGMDFPGDNDWDDDSDVDEEEEEELDWALRRERRENDW